MQTLYSIFIVVTLGLFIQEWYLHQILEPGYLAMSLSGICLFFTEFHRQRLIELSQKNDTLFDIAHVNAKLILHVGKEAGVAVDKRLKKIMEEDLE